MTSIGTRQHQSSGESATPGRQRKLALSWIKDSLASTPDGTGRRGGARNPKKRGSDERDWLALSLLIPPGG
jgi:hypothetical protein